uniref:Uncharacterized protein n=1 Tax=Glossina palpalis gambiensis TaxID=67801 RepID=A0A1B0BYW1_9MUSC
MGEYLYPYPIWCITAEILNVRLPVTTLLQMICHWHVWFGSFRPFELLWHRFIKGQHIGRFLYWPLVDIILVALQIVRPANGSYYIIPCYGAVVETIRSDNETYRVPKDDW